MDEVKLTASEVAVGVLQLFPPPIRAAALEDPQFRREFGLSVDANIKFDPSGITIGRAKLFSAVRRALGDPSAEVTVASVDGVEWRLERNDTKDKVLLVRDDRRVTLPDFTCLSPDSAERLAWFDHEAKKFLLDQATIKKWRDSLAASAMEDEDVDNLLSEFRFAPIYVANAISGYLRRETINISTLVPADARYYDRLVGPYDGDANVIQFVSSGVRAHIARLLLSGVSEGLGSAFLLAAHPAVTQAIDHASISNEELLRVYDWLEKGGDRISQLGAIEFGLAHLDFFPNLEQPLLRLSQIFLDDDPDNKEGRLSLLSSLIVLVDGELARTGIVRKRPPFWRRLAAIAQASLIERQMMAADIPLSTFIDWAMQGRGHPYYMQTLADLRTEPRWLPDFILPNQLKAEFLGRISAAAHVARGKIQSPELRSLLLESAPEGLQAALHFPFAFLPGPLEGGVESVLEMPQHIEEELRNGFVADVLTPKSFAALVNSALIFRIGPTLAQLAAQALRRVKHQLREVKEQGEAFSLLSGLATVAAVTRSTELGDEVRILARVVRRRAGINIAPEDLMRIGMIAAASNNEIGKWCKFVGDWMTELTFEDIGHDGAVTLRQHIRRLCHSEPQLWETCARAEAACDALAGA